MTGRDPVPGLDRDPERRAARSRDFGGMVEKMPSAVVTPRSVEDVSRIVSWAAREGVQLAIRGGGHSQGGQCLTAGGIVLDTRRLDRVSLVGGNLVRAQGGAAWIKVVDSLHGTGCLPCVLADFGELTVGGTLSAGGVGTTSHRYGAQVGQVEQLEVVTGSGERVLCSRDRNTDLFDAVRGGQGQFGIITDAWIRLRKAGNRFRLYEFRWRDFDRFASDFERLVDEDRFDHLRAEFRGHDRQVILRAGVEFDDRIDLGQTLDEGLGSDTKVIVWDTAAVGHAGLLPRWIVSRTNYHPWRDWFLPWKIMRTAMDQPWLDLNQVPRWPRSWTGIYPIKTESIDAPLFTHPKGERMILYSVLTVMDDVEKARELAETLKTASRELVALGAKRYLSSGVGHKPEEWAEHWGAMFETCVAWKRTFDPHGVFTGNGLQLERCP